MSTINRNRILGSTTTDDSFKTEQTRDLSGGANTQLDSQDLPANQAVVVQNVDIGVQGKRIVRPGLTLLEDLANDRTLPYMSSFEPDGGTNALDVVVLSGTDTAIFTWPTSGTFSKVTGTDNLIDTNCIEVTAFKTGGDGDVRLYGSPTKNWIEVKQNGTVTDLGNTQGTGSDSPPQSNVATFYNSRLWVQKDNVLAFSDALPGSYANTFDTQSTGNTFNMPVGDERFIIGIREKGLIIGGKNLIRYLVPGDTPDADDPNGVLVNIGCEAGRTACLVGEDILYLARDGVRSISRTEYDTMQYRSSLPLSYPLKDSLELVNWAHIDKACGFYFDNKYFLSLPINSSETNNAVWVYYPASNGWMVIDGWEVSAFSQVKVNGKNYLYATDATDGKVYKAWSGTSDNGTAIEYIEEHRKYDVDNTFETKTGGEVFIRVKATGYYNIDVYASFDEGSYNKLGTLTTEDRTTNFTAWTLPMIFKGDGFYAKKFHIDTYGPFYQMQIKVETTELAGSDLTIVETSLITKLDKYFSEERGGY